MSGLANQSSCTPRSSITSSAPSASAMSAAPGRSKCTPRSQRRRRSSTMSGGSSTIVWTRKSDSSPTGTLMRKIQCQENWSVIQPPSSGPSIGARITVKPYTDIALPREAGGKVSISIAWVTGCRPPPPTPWTMRARIRTVSEGASPQHSEAKVKRRDAGHVVALAPEDVGQPAAHRDDGRVGDEIAGQDPGRLVVARGGGARDVRERDVGDRGVQHLHEGGDRDHGGDEPGVAVARGGARRRPPLRGAGAGAGASATQRTLTVGSTDMPGPSTQSAGSGVERDPHRHPLHHLDVVAGGVLRRQQRESLARTALDGDDVAAGIGAAGRRRCGS